MNRTTGNDQKVTLTISVVKCDKCGSILEIEPVIKRGVGVVYTCSCGHKTGIRIK